MFSVVIPAYNCENTICTVLDSVKNQTRIDLIEEIIIVNDGSTDNTEQIIKQYIENNPNIPINYIKQENKGVSYTRNAGIRKSKSDWIALLDSDDVWLPNKIEQQYEQVRKNPEILFLGSEYPLKIYLKKYTSGVHKLTASALCFRSTPVTPSVIFHRETGIELGLFNESMQYCEDINFYQKFLLKDSYYVLAEDLVRIGIGKKYHGVWGLSSNLKKMNQGRNKNVEDLYEMELISIWYKVITIAFNYVKLLRRMIILKMCNMIKGK